MEYYRGEDIPDELADYFEPAKVAHPTVKPAALMAFLIALSTREGDLVLDPFCGSGSTGVSAKRMGRAFVGIDLDEDFCRISRARIAAAETVEAEPQEQAELELAGGETDGD